MKQWARRLLPVMMPILLSGLLPGLHGRSLAQEAAAGSSVLVTTEPVRRGSLADIVVAYGSVLHDVNSIMTLSLPQEGRVMHVAASQGEAVSAGQMLIEFSSSPQAESRLAEARTALALAQQQRRHASQLLVQHLVTRDQLAQSEKMLEDAQSTLGALDQERAGAARLGLTAPFSGMVQTLFVAPGDRMTAGAPLMTLAREDGLIVTAGIEPSLRSRIHPGQAVAVADLHGGGAVNGRLLRIDGQLNPRTHLVDVVIALPDTRINAGPLMGEAVRAEITVGQPQGWLVPRQAVVLDVASRDDQVPVVYQALGGHAVRVPVALDVEQGEQELVTGRLDPSRPLVTRGVYQLTDGAAIRLRQ